MDYKVQDRVYLHHCDGQIPSIVTDVNPVTRMVQLKVVGDGKTNPAWMGLHWFKASDVSPIK